MGVEVEPEIDDAAVAGVEVFGRYQLVELLGEGGMGRVYRAYDTATERMVALKVLAPQLAKDRVFQQRFRREAEVAARLADPHIVPIHQYGEIEGRLYVDMRLVEGRDLGSIIAETGPLAPERAVAIVEQVAEALTTAYSMGLVHRDIKPSNILIARHDFAYLIDFGIAWVADQTRMTSVGSMIGTFAYMAPERFESSVAEHRWDVYALACVLHECLTGQQPFPGESLPQQIAAHITAPPPCPSRIQAGVDPEFDRVIAAGMAKKPAERLPTARALASAARAAIPFVDTVELPREQEPTSNGAVVAVAETLSVPTQEVPVEPPSSLAEPDAEPADTPATEQAPVDLVKHPTTEPTQEAKVAPTAEAPVVSVDLVKHAPTEERPIAAEPALFLAPPSRRPRRYGLIATVAAAVLLIGGAVAMFGSGGDTETPAPTPVPTMTSPVRSATTTPPSTSASPTPTTTRPSATTTTRPAATISTTTAVAPAPTFTQTQAPVTTQAPVVTQTPEPAPLPAPVATQTPEPAPTPEPGSPFVIETQTPAPVVTETAPLPFPVPTTVTVPPTLPPPP